jgi:hypothetical protein
MMTPTEFAAALDFLPEEMCEPAAAYLLEQAGKFRRLKELAAEGMDDVAAPRRRPARRDASWNGIFETSWPRRASRDRHH